MSRRRNANAKRARSHNAIPFKTPPIFGGVFVFGEDARPCLRNVLAPHSNQDATSSPDGDSYGRQYGVTRSLMYFFVGYTPRGTEPHTGGTGHEDYALDRDRRSRRQVDHRAFQRERGEAGQRVRTGARCRGLPQADQVRQGAGWRGSDRVRGRPLRIRALSAADQSWPKV